MFHRPILFTILSAFISTLTLQANAIVIRDDEPDASYLAAATAFPSVGIWFNGAMICTATVVEVSGGNGWAVTSATCVGGMPGEFRLGDDYNNPTSIHPVVSASPHPSYDGSPDHDLAVIRFVGATAATPLSPIYTGTDQYGQMASFVGYGLTGTGITGGTTASTLKRAATNEIDRVGSGGLTHIADFDDPGNPGASSMGSTSPLALEGMGCFGELGAGIFVDFGGGAGQELIGTFATLTNVSGGSLCDYGDTSESVSLVENFDFLNVAIYGGAQVLIRVPEPSATTLLLSGAFALWGLGRRRRRRGAPFGVRD